MRTFVEVKIKVGPLSNVRPFHAFAAKLDKAHNRPAAVSFPCYACPAKHVEST